MNGVTGLVVNLFKRLNATLTRGISTRKTEGEGGGGEHFELTVIIGHVHGDDADQVITLAELAQE